MPPNRTAKKKPKAPKTKTKLKPKRTKKLGLAKFLPSSSKPKKIRPKVDPAENEQPQKANKVPVVENKAKNLSLVDRCKLQMSSSLLRLIDEDLYTSDTNNVPIDKNKFLAYHEAYADVCDKWPVKPIDYIVKFIKKRLLVKKPLHKWKFADVGCGREPLLKMKLPPKANVRSFDLVSTHKDVIEANMENLPIDNQSVDCVIYSLSLMAKNLGKIILEGKRVLKIGGSMLIVEVTSRFEGQERRFTGRLEKLGFKQKSMSILKPNGYFTFFHFTKLDSKNDYSASAMNVQLKPCVYKSR